MLELKVAADRKGQEHEAIHRANDRVVWPFGIERWIATSTCPRPSWGEGGVSCPCASPRPTTGSVRACVRPSPTPGSGPHRATICPRGHSSVGRARRLHRRGRRFEPGWLHWTSAHSCGVVASIAAARRSFPGPGRRPRRPRLSRGAPAGLGRAGCARPDGSGPCALGAAWSEWRCGPCARMPEPLGARCAADPCPRAGDAALLRPRVRPGELRGEPTGPRLGPLASAWRRAGRIGLHAG